MRADLMREVTRWLIIACGALLLAMATSAATRNVYSREYVDREFESVRGAHHEDMRRIERELDHIHADVKWLVRERGGTPSAEAETK